VYAGQKGTLNTGRGPLRHLGPVLLLAILTCVWTWPLILHLKTHLPGEPGDNFSFVWNLWWMRETLGTPGLTFLWTDYLFAPFGVSLVNHSHTALAAVLGATVLRPFSPAEAENIIVLASVFLAAVSMYALTWDITRARSASVAGAIIFAGSPHMASKLAAGHLELVSIWVFPMFALAFRRALRNHSTRAAAGAGVILAAAAYSAYYYVVYLALFAATYLLAWSGWIGFTVASRIQNRLTKSLTAVALVLLADALALAIWIVASGGGSFTFASTSVSVHGPQNPLTAAWLLAIGLLLLRWRPVLRLARPGPLEIRTAVWTVALVALVFLAATLPLTRAALDLWRQGGYSSAPQFWRSSPGGVDLITPFLGNPFHPLMGKASSRAYAWAYANRIEGIAWLGVVPLLVLIIFRALPEDRADSRIWWMVLGVSVLWAVGPILTVAGFDTGLFLPQMLARFVPVVANARIPGRAMVLVYLALGVLVAKRLAAARAWRDPVGRWIVPALLVVDYLNAPIPLSRLDQPIAYERLAEIHDGGAVCEVPFGFGDGLWGMGSQDRHPLYYATLHGHPLVGGYIGRFPTAYGEQYARLPLVGNLLRLSMGERPLPEVAAGPPPCRYLVVHRDSAPAAVVEHVRSTLPLQWLAGDGDVDLYRVD
jgi:hypothetical protein